MTPELLFDSLLCLLLISAALLAVNGRDLFASIAFFVTYGILIGLAWLRLGAVDVALAEVAIGAGLTGVLLLGAWSVLRSRDAHELSAHRLPLWHTLGAAAAAVGVSGMLGLAVLELPAQAPGQTAEVQANLQATGVENPVTAVLLNFRAFDTLLESTVLLIALVAVWVLTPARLWGRAAGRRQHARPGGVLATFGRLLPPVGLMVAIYLLWAGTDMPGGAFQAGTVLAAVWLLAVMAGATDAPGQSSRSLRFILILGPGLFLLIGLLGATFGAFLGLPTDLARPLTVVIEVALTVSIAASLALLVAGTPRTDPA